MEKQEPPEHLEKLDLRVPLELAERLAKLDRPGERVQVVLQAKLGLRGILEQQESRARQELLASLELLERLAKQGLLERLGLPVPRGSRVVVVQPVKPEQREALAQLARQGQQDSQE